VVVGDELAVGEAHVRVRVDAAALALDGALEAREVLEDVELELVGEAQGGAGVEVWRAGDALNGQADLAAGLQLVVEGLRLVRRVQEEVAVDALHVAADGLVLHDGGDGLDGLGVALRGQAGGVQPVLVPDDAVAVVEGVGEVGRRAPRLPRAQGSVVEKHDVQSRDGEVVRRRQARDAAPHDAHVRALLLAQGPGADGAMGGRPQAWRDAGRVAPLRVLVGGRRAGGAGHAPSSAWQAA
jgi:hypothetical protein